MKQLSERMRKLGMLQEATPTGIGRKRKVAPTIELVFGLSGAPWRDTVGHLTVTALRLVGCPPATLW